MPDQTYSMTLANEIIIAANGPGGSSTFPASGTVNFDIIVNDSCYGVEIYDPTFTVTSVLIATVPTDVEISVTNG